MSSTVKSVSRKYRIAVSLRNSSTTWRNELFSPRSFRRSVRSLIFRFCATSWNRVGRMEIFDEDFLNLSDKPPPKLKFFDLRVAQTYHGRVSDLVAKPWRTVEPARIEQ